MALYKPEQSHRDQDLLSRTDGMVGRNTPQLPAKLHQPLPGMSKKTQFILVLCATMLIASVVSNFVARWIGLPHPGAAYRRIGLVNGPQVFVAGSSLLQFGLSWPKISKILGQGMENWGVGGSSPSEWEASQVQATNVNLMIIGVSVYDLNEYHLGNARANVVPLAWTIRDLWNSGIGWHFSKHLLSQYPLAYLREIFPTAGNSDAVMVGLRRKLPTSFRKSAAAEDSANSMVVPRDAVMEFGGSTERMSDWPAAKTLRRVALMRSETQGMNAFDGPKLLAMRRMMQHAQACGSNIVVVLPVAPLYTTNFMTPKAGQDFESVLAKIHQEFPAAQIVRLDQVPALQSDDLFGDPVHLNGAGRDIATSEFLKSLKLPPASP